MLFTQNIGGGAGKLLFRPSKKMVEVLVNYYSVRSAAIFKKIMAELRVDYYLCNQDGVKARPSKGYELQNNGGGPGELLLRLSKKKNW